MGKSLSSKESNPLDAPLDLIELGGGEGGMAKSPLWRQIIFFICLLLGAALLLFCLEFATVMAEWL